MRVEISRMLLERIAAHAASQPGQEVCGLLFGTTARITAVEPCANVAPDPARRFEIDPARLLAAHRAMGGGGPRLIGHYHSHPAGPATPSLRDADAAAADGALWLILAGNGIAAWRAVERGTTEGRFDPVELVVAPGCASPDASPEGPAMRDFGAVEP